MKPWLVLVVIFVAGAVTGAALTMGVGSHFLRSGPPDAQQMKKIWLAHLTRRLDLTADQQAKIEPILAGAGDQLQKVHREEVDRASGIFEDTSRKLAAILTPAQQAQLDQMEKEDRDRMFSGHHRPWGPPPGADDRPHPPDRSDFPPSDATPPPASPSPDGKS